MSEANVQISHHTGAVSRTLSFQTMAFTPRFRHATAVHAMNRHVPEFHA